MVKTDTIIRTADANMEYIVQFVISGLVIISGIIEGVVLRFMNTAKDAVLILYSSKFLVCFLGGLLTLVRSVTLIKPSQPGCVYVLPLVFVFIGSYETHTLILYIEMYLSLKSMAIHDPPITKSKSIMISVFTWVIWIGVGALGFLLDEPDWFGETMGECHLPRQFKLVGYNTTMYVILLGILIAIFVLYKLTGHLLSDSMKNDTLHRPQGLAGRGKDRVESNAGQNNDAAESNAGQNKDAAESNAGQNKDATEFNAGQNKDATESNAGQSNDATESNAGQNNDAAQSNAGQNKDAAESNAGQIKDGTDDDRVTDTNRKTRKSKYLKDRQRGLTILAIRALVMMACFGISHVCGLVLHTCAPCRELAPYWLVYVFEVCYAIPAISNGGSFLFTNEKFIKKLKGCLCK